MSSQNTLDGLMTTKELWIKIQQQAELQRAMEINR